MANTLHPPPRRVALRRRWRHVVPLAVVLMAATQAHAQWVIPEGFDWDMVGGSNDLACTDLIVEGVLTVGAGGAVTGARNVVITATGSVNLAGGTLNLAQQWTNQGVFTAGGGQVVRVDGGMDCSAQGPLGPFDPLAPEVHPGAVAPQPVPATGPGMLAALSLLLGGLGWHLRHRRAGTLAAPRAPGQNSSHTHSNKG